MISRHYRYWKLRSRLDPQLSKATGNLIIPANSGFREISELVELPHLLGIVRKIFENMNKWELEGLGR